MHDGASLLEGCVPNALYHQYVHQGNAHAFLALLVASSAPLLLHFHHQLEHRDCKQRESRQVEEGQSLRLKV